jgi:hypothetical protein
MPLPQPTLPLQFMLRIITQLVAKMEKKMTSNIGNNIEAYAEAARKHRPEAVCLG